MDDAEWGAFVLELDHGFKGEFGGESPSGKAQEGVYRAHLGGLDYPVATAALALLVADGKVFTPMPGELLGAVQRLTTRKAPAFVEAYPRIRRLCSRHPATHPAMPGFDRDQRAQAWTALVADVAAELGEGAARFVQSKGVQLYAEHVDDPEHGGKVLHRLTAEYAACCEAATEDRHVGYALERAKRRELNGGQEPGLRKLFGGVAPALPERTGNG